MSQTRRLAAILAADVAGYSRLMGADEEGTLERLTALRRELVDPKITEHRRRIVKTTSDGLLVEFASVVDAVRCAVAAQQAMAERDTGVGADSRIELRIGIKSRRCDRREPGSRVRPLPQGRAELATRVTSRVNSGQSRHRNEPNGEDGGTHRRPDGREGDERCVCCGAARRYGGGRACPRPPARGAPGYAGA